MPEPTRKLAAIVFTDIVGFTKLTADDQQKASDLLDIQRNEIKPIVESYGGLWIKEMGDGLILTFNTITNAVKCSIKIQAKAKTIDDLNLRIGIHLGEILEKEGDIIGDDVNVAARIEPFAAPGGIAISNKVNDALIREADFKTKYLGKPKLKGVGQEVKVYCITSHGLPETDLSQVSAKLEPEGFQWNVMNSLGVAASMIGLFMLINFMFLRIGYADKDETPSIAILPFENKGAEADEFYAYGISSDLIADVTSAGLIRVAGLKDIEKLDYSNMSYDDLSKKLFVRYVAQGTLWKMDSVFQLSMEIFDTKLSKVVYTKRWQTNWTDLATIKDDLSDNILETLEIKILQDPEKQIVESNPEAYEYYLRAKHKYDKIKTKDDTEIAKGLIRKAINLDENLLDAKLLLGDILEDYGEMDGALELYTEVLEQAEEIGDKSSVGNSLSDIGGIYWKKGDYKQALDNYLKAKGIFEKLDAKANVATCLHSIGILHEYKGEIDTAIAHYQKAYDMYEEIDHRGGMASGLNALGIGSSIKGDYDKAIEYYKMAIPIAEEMESIASIGSFYGNMGYEYNAKGEYELALEYYNKSLEISKELGNKVGIAWMTGNIGAVYRNMGDYEQTLKQYQNALLIREELKDTTNIASRINFIGNMHFWIGENDKALEYYEKSFSIRNEIGNNYLITNSLNSFGIFYCLLGEYKKSASYLEKSIKLMQEEKKGEYEKDWGVLTYLYLSYKQLGKEYDEEEIPSLLEDTNIEDFDYNHILIFALYQLLEDNSFLETSYNTIRGKTKWLDDEKMEKFLNYPIPRQIVEEWEKVNA